MGGAGHLTRDQGDRTHYILELLLPYTDFLCYPWQVSCAPVQCKPGYLCQPKRAQTSPWGPSQGLNYRQNECALVQNTQCAKGFVTAGGPLGPHGTVYVVGRVNSFPSSLFFIQQQQNATHPVHGNWLEEQHLGHYNLVKKGSMLRSPNTDESLSYSLRKLATSSLQTQGKE